MATRSSVLAWRIPGMGEPDGLPPMGSHRVGHDWSDLAAACLLICECSSNPACTMYLTLHLNFLNIGIWRVQPPTQWKYYMDNILISVQIFQWCEFHEFLRQCNPLMHSSLKWSLYTDLVFTFLKLLYINPCSGLRATYMNLIPPSTQLTVLSVDCLTFQYFYSLELLLFDL